MASSRDSADSDLDRRLFLQTGGATSAAQSVAKAGLDFASWCRPWRQTSDKRVRIGVVGGDFGAAFHWHEHPNCVVAAVSDLTAERRAHLMKTYRCAKAYDSLAQLVLDPDIDAVAVFSGAPNHARDVVCCMEHGKHVISACPACISLEQAAQLKEVKERTGLKYMSAETSYFRWETITARHLMQSGVLGNLVYTEAEYYHPRITRADDGLSVHGGQRTWRYGYPPMLYPTHATAFLVGVTRERLVKVSCIGTGDENEPALKDNPYRNPFLNGMALFLTNLGNPFRCNVAWNIRADGERAQWFGTKGCLYMAGSSGQPFAVQAEEAEAFEMPDYWPMVPPAMRRDSGHGRSHPFLTNEFVMALVEDREPVIDLYEALAFCVPGIVAHESALQGGAQLDIPSFDRK